MKFKVGDRVRVLDTEDSRRNLINSGTKAVVCKEYTISRISSNPASAHPYDLGDSNCYWTPEVCLELVDVPAVDSPFKVGDRVKVTKPGYSATSEGPGTVTEIDYKEKRVRIKFDSGWKPDPCGFMYLFNVVTKLSPGEQDSVVEQTKQSEVPDLKESENTMLSNVTFMKTPSLVQQQAGENESIVGSTTQVISNDNTAGIAIAAAKNAEAILALKDDAARLRVIVNNLG